MPGGTTFTIFPRERRMNQTECVVPKLDVFTNGMLAAIELVAGEHDNDSLVNNPNILERDNVDKIFRLKGRKFEQRIAKIDAPATLMRLLEKAEDERTQATVQQLRMVQDRLDAVNIVVGHVRPSIDQAIRDGAEGPSTSEKAELFKPVRLKQ